MGIVMVFAGFAWFLTALTQANDPDVFALGTAVNDIPWAFFAYLILAYPEGRLSGRASQAIVAGAFFITMVVRPLWTLSTDLTSYHPDAPPNGLQVWDAPGFGLVLERTIQLVALVLIAGAIAILYRRWRDAPPRTRRSLAPPFLAFTGTVVLLAGAVLLQAFGLRGASDPFFWASMAALLTVPLSFAVGLLRTRLAQAGVGNLLVELGEVRRAGDLRRALARALGDETLEIAYWIPERETFVDEAGNPLPPPASGGGRSATVVERGGRPIAALLHEASLRTDAELLDTVGAAAALALENERRHAELAQSEARLRALVEAMPDLMIRLDRDGTYLDVQGRETDLVAPPRELLGRRLEDVLPAEPADRIMRCVTRLRPGHVETVEYTLRIGPLNRHFEARVASINSDEVVLIIRDISDRKRTELQIQRLQDELRVRFDELERERDFIRAVVEAAPSYFCLVDGEGRIARFNRSLERASGRSDDGTVTGEPFWKVFVVDEDEEAVRTLILEAARSGGTTGEHESRWRGAEGEPMHVAWSVTSLLDEDGEPRFLVTGVDVTERKRQEAELRSSRARLVEVAATERRRLERNLHDGAQQRLVSLSLFLRLAQGKVPTDPDGAVELLTQASDELSRALEELRELARGIHPAILTDRGLEPALQALVTRSPVPVTVAEAPDQRLPEAVEAAAYYVVAEALTNVAKYAQASAATVRVLRDDGYALVEVADDGVGGADPTTGSGLRGLADRVAALDGRLEVKSAAGAGTTIRAEIPVDAVEA
jgi:PAS domain S-box-containing protein